MLLGKCENLRFIPRSHVKMWHVWQSTCNPMLWGEWRQENPKVRWLPRVSRNGECREALPLLRQRKIPNVNFGSPYTLSHKLGSTKNHAYTLAHTSHISMYLTKQKTSVLNLESYRLIRALFW